MSAFDQRGQKVENQQNIAGDLHQHQAGSGDTINMSGDFRGAVVNVKSTLNDVSQTINTMPNAEPSLKAELNQLIKQLGQALEKAPREKDEEAEAVAQTAKVLVDTATDEKPNKNLVRITGEGLKQAAQDIAEVMPTVLTIATQIVGVVSRIVGM